MDLQRLSGLLRKLSPRQEKVLRLYFGLGCERPHSAQEMAQELGVSAHVIGGILGAAQRRLAGEGWTTRDLRDAARQQSKPPGASTQALMCAAMVFMRRSTPVICGPSEWGRWWAENSRMSCGAWHRGSRPVIDPLPRNR